MPSCNNCKIILKKYNIKDNSSFKKWSLKNHPNKGGNKTVFKQVSSCVDDFFGLNTICTDNPRKSTKRKSKRKSTKRKKRKSRKSTKRKSKRKSKK
jgi:hypothetical protein